MGFLRFDSPIMQKLGLLFELMVLNVVTILCSLPVFTMGAAVSALYDTVWRMRKNEGTLLRNYFRAFGANFKGATAMYIPLLLTGLIFGYNFLLVAMNHQSGQGYILVPLGICFAVWAIITAWAFPLQTRFENTVIRIYVNALLCGLQYLPRTIAMVLLNVFPWVLLVAAPVQFLKFSVLWMLLWFAGAAYLNLIMLTKPLERLTELSQAAAEQARETEESDDIAL